MNIEKYIRCEYPKKTMYAICRTSNDGIYEVLSQKRTSEVTATWTLKQMSSTSVMVAWFDVDKLLEDGLISSINDTKIDGKDPMDYMMEVFSDCSVQPIEPEQKVNLLTGKYFRQYLWHTQSSSPSRVTRNFLIVNESKDNLSPVKLPENVQKRLDAEMENNRTKDMKSTLFESFVKANALTIVNDMIAKEQNVPMLQSLQFLYESIENHQSFMIGDELYHRIVCNAINDWLNKTFGECGLTFHYDISNPKSTICVHPEYYEFDTNK